MIRVRWIAISFVMWQRCFPHIGMFSVLHRECINLHEGRLRNKMHLHSTLKGCFFCVKRFWPITRVENNSQEKFTILHVLHIGFLCYSGWDQILLYGRWLESKDEYTALWSFVNVCCLSQSEVSTDNRKGSTFFCISTCSLPLLLSFFSGPFLNNSFWKCFNPHGKANWQSRQFRWQFDDKYF